MKKNETITLHLNKDEKRIIQQAADLYGISIKQFIEQTIPYISKKLKEGDYNVK